MEKEKLRLVNIRLGLSDLIKLRTHFVGKGLNLSAGIRMVLRDYVNKIKASE